jgi:hypothetical protein
VDGGFLRPHRYLVLLCWLFYFAWSSDSVPSLLRFAGSNAIRFASAEPVYFGDGLKSRSTLRDWLQIVWLEMAFVCCYHSKLVVFGLVLVLAVGFECYFQWSYSVSFQLICFFFFAIRFRARARACWIVQHVCVVGCFRLGFCFFNLLRLFVFFCITLDLVLYSPVYISFYFKSS